MSGRKADTGGVYELRYRLERSYRPWGWVFGGFGAVGFVVAIVFAEPWLLLCSGPALAAGLWLLLKDPREYLVVEPRTRRLKLVRCHGRQVRVRREYDLREFTRLETAQYLNRPRGLRTMLLLFRGDGSVEKVDDRLHEPTLVRLCGDAAQAAGLDFVDRGRVDQDVEAPTIA